MTPDVSDTFLEIISLEDIRDELSTRLVRCFTEVERQRLETAPIQTIAGQIALKSAICRLAKDALGTAALPLRAVILSHTQEGAPKVVAVAGVPDTIQDAIRDRVCVSISHSRQNAVGLAVLKETAND